MGAIKRKRGEALVLKLKESILTDFADVKLAVLLFSVGLLLLVLSLLLLESLLLTQAAVTVMLASIIYLLLRYARRRKQYDIDTDEETSDKPLFSPYVNQILDIAFWGLLIGAMFMLTQGVYARPLGFLMIVSAMAAILAVQIFSGKSVGYCLLKVMIIGVLLRASAYYQFPGAVGYDSVAEITLTEQMVSSGHVGSFMGGYQYYPVAHYFTSMSSLLTGMRISDSFFMLGITEVLSLVFIFLIGRHFFNTKTGLLAILIISVFDWHILWGFYIKAMTFGIALLPMILYLVFAAPRKNKFLFTLLALLVMAMLIMTHTFVTAVLVVILAAGWLMFLILTPLSSKEDNKQPLTLNIVLLFICATMAYWMYVSGFTYYIVDTINYALSLDPQKLAILVFPMSIAEELWVKLPTFMFIFFAILGCLAVFNIREFSQKRLLRIWLALLCGALVIVNFVIFYIPQLGPLVRERWFVFVGLIIAIPVARGIMYIAGRKSWQAVTATFLLVLCLSGVMTTSYISNVQSVITWGPESYHASTASELVAADTISQALVSADDYIYAEHYYSQIFRWNIEMPYEQVIDFSEIYSYELEDYQGILMLRMAAINIVSA